MNILVPPWSNHVLSGIENCFVSRSFHGICLSGKNKNVIPFSLDRVQKLSLFCVNNSAMPKPIKSKQKGSKIKSKDVNLQGAGNSTIPAPKSINLHSSFKKISNENVKKKSVKRKKKKKNDPVAQLTNSFSKLDVNSKSSTSASKPIKTAVAVSTRHFSLSAGSTRTSGHKIETLEDVARYIRTGRAKNIIAMCGAGISTASGIPDFRTPGTGLYYNLQKYNIPTPTSVFDLDYFHMKPRPFFELAKELYPSGKYRPNLAHYFLRSLHEKGLLLRLYTQNIDGLERLAGIPPSKLVEAHGTFTTASCTQCGKKYNGETIKKKIFKNQIPRCEVTPLCHGIVKPDIVFFGEDLPKRFYYYLKDFPNCDLLIVMGTSLEVEPFASLVDSVRHGAPRLLINREKVGPFKSKSRNTDAVAAGEMLEVVERFTALLGWKRFVNETMEEHEKLYEAESSSDAQTDSGISSASSESEPKESRKTELLPPPNGNIKRYFHTIRSTPLPKAKSVVTESTEITPIPPSLSYFDYLRNHSAAKTKHPGDKLLPDRPSLKKFTFEKAPKIEYAQKIERKNSKTSVNSRKLSCASMPSRLFDFSSSDDQSDSTSSDSES